MRCSLSFAQVSAFNNGPTRLSSIRRKSAKNRNTVDATANNGRPREKTRRINIFHNAYADDDTSSMAARMCCDERAAVGGLTAEFK